MTPALHQAVAAARAAARPFAIVTRLADGVQRLVDDDGDSGDLPLSPALLAQIRDRLRDGVSGPLGEDALFVRVYAAPWRLEIVGAVHIAQHLAPMAAACGWAVRVIDPRAGFLTSSRFPGLDLCLGWPDDILADSPPNPRTAVVALSHDPKIDDPALIAALRTPCGYVGALGSRRSHARRCDRLRLAGVDDEALARIHAPIGLDLGGRAPAEIAVSVLAQVIAKRYGR